MGRSLLPFEVEVKKPLTKDYFDEWDDPEELENLNTTCFLEEVALYQDLNEWEGGCLL